jgi:hypothetical protein
LLCERRRQHRRQRALAHAPDSWAHTGHTDRLSRPCGASAR